MNNDTLVMTEAQLKILRHMLGIDDPYKSEAIPYRDYYCAELNNRELRELERIGAVRLTYSSEHYDWYTTTEAGKSAAMLSFTKYKKPKSKRVYKRYLNITDVFPDLTFKEFLTDIKFADIRKTA